MNADEKLWRARAREAGLRWPGGVHPVESCKGRGCPIHGPSDHHMKDWTLHWRRDTYVMERICVHGVGHPDPDHVRYVHESRAGEHGPFTSKASLNDAPEIHGCDGCCHPPTCEHGVKWGQYCPPPCKNHVWDCKCEECV